MGIMDAWQRYQNLQDPTRTPPYFPETPQIPQLPNNGYQPGKGLLNMMLAYQQYKNQQAPAGMNPEDAENPTTPQYGQQMPQFQAPQVPQQKKGGLLGLFKMFF